MDAKKLKEILQSKKVSAKEFAIFLGVTQRTVHHWLNGDRSIPPFLYMIIDSHHFEKNCKKNMEMSNENSGKRNEENVKVQNQIDKLARIEERKKDNEGASVDGRVE